MLSSRFMRSWRNGWTTAAIGLWQLWRTRRDRGAIFVGALLVLIVVPYSLAGTKFLRYMLPAFALLTVVPVLLDGIPR